jgi:hypothetical protein
MNEAEGKYRGQLYLTGSRNWDHIRTAVFKLRRAGWDAVVGAIDLYPVPDYDAISSVNGVALVGNKGDTNPWYSVELAIAGHYGKDVKYVEDWIKDALEDTKLNRELESRVLLSDVDPNGLETIKVQAGRYTITLTREP